MTDTIVAIATPPGRGGVGIVRVSGPSAFEIGTQLSHKKILSPRLMIHCNFLDVKEELIDKGLIVYFQSPNSFTGEDIIECHCHGSPIVLDQLTKICLQYGARLAKPGEFSERAFLNDKIDLAQAEAIADLIEASSLQAVKMAARSLQGDFSDRIQAISEKLVYLRLYVEASIDFPDEEIDLLQDSRISCLLSELIEQITQLRAEAYQGSLLREGMSVVIAGKPNAGKSTLINQLAGREVAIVTPIAGTTRDVMRESILIDDLPVELIDTAGLRESEDLVEQEGIKRAWKEIQQADCILLVSDVNDSEVLSDFDSKLLAEFPATVPVIKLFNKIDLINMEPEVNENTIFLSAKEGQGLTFLKQKLKALIGFQPAEGHFSARRRHLEAIDQALNLLTLGQSQLFEHQAGELLAEDLRLAHQALTEITGEFSSDDLLGKIFSSFCIGK